MMLGIIPFYSPVSFVSLGHVQEKSHKKRALLLLYIHHIAGRAKKLDIMCCVYPSADRGIHTVIRKGNQLNDR